MAIFYMYRTAFKEPRSEECGGSTCFVYVDGAIAIAAGVTCSEMYMYGE